MVPTAPEIRRLTKTTSPSRPLVVHLIQALNASGFVFHAQLIWLKAAVRVEVSLVRSFFVQFVGLTA
jgi:hypothetical protein